MKRAGAEASGKEKRKKSKKSKAVQLLEYGTVCALLLIARATPLGIIRLLSSFSGNLFYLLVKRRRTIAIENLTHAFAGEKTESEIRSIARRSCISFFLTFLEITKFQNVFLSRRVLGELEKASQDVDMLFRKAKRIHDESGGCIFVTPHIGNWEILPHVSSVVGIPLVVVVRPLDNPYLEQLLYTRRADSGQIIIPKRNALFVLQRTLQQGKSIGMLPDQSTMQGIPVVFFGRKATTTPVPAILSVTYGRPIVVVACCRSANGRHFEGFVSDPIWPGEFRSEKEEIYRLTEAMNKTMEEVIRSYPDQYLWMHNRWKTYRNKTALMA